MSARGGGRGNLNGAARAPAGGNGVCDRSRLMSTTRATNWPEGVDGRWQAWRGGRRRFNAVGALDTDPAPATTAQAASLNAKTAALAHTAPAPDPRVEAVINVGGFDYHKIMDEKDLHGHLHYRSFTLGTFGSFGKSAWKIIDEVCDSDHPHALDDFNSWRDPDPRRRFILSVGFALQRGNSRMLRQADRRRSGTRYRGRRSGVDLSLIHI